MGYRQTSTSLVQTFFNKLLGTWLALAPLALAQVSPILPPTPDTVPTAPNTLAWQATPRDGLSTAWQAAEPVTNALTGAVTTKQHNLIEVASGLNYLDSTTGQFQASQDLIELTADGGAAAVHGPAKLYVEPNLNTVGAITIVTVNNRVLQTRPLGLFFYDAKTGQAQLLAPVQDCVGELVPPNQVVWKSAFGPLADLRLTYTKSAIESDVVLRQQPALPEGWDPQTTRLEVWHEESGGLTPRLTPRVLYSEGNAILRSQMLEPDETDQMLDFGDLWFPTGALYATDGSDAPPAGTARTVQVPNAGSATGLAPVAKTWLTTPAGNVLVEAARWPDLETQIAHLPPAMQSAFPTTAVPFTQADRLACLNQLSAPRAVPQPGIAITTATESYQPAGCVLDYITVPSPCSANYTFDTYNGSNTYYVSGSTYFSATVTFNQGCIIKSANNAYLLIYGSIVCNGTTTNPSLLTAWNDDLYGARLPNSYGCPTYAAAKGIWDYFINANVTLSGLRIRWAQTGVEFDANGCSQYTDTLANSSLEFCQTGIYENDGNLTINSSTRCSVATPVSSYYGCTTITGSLTDIGSGDADGNGLTDSEDYQYFGRLGTLPGHIVGQMANHVNNHTPPADQTIWSFRDDNDGIYQYNSGCWLAGVQGLSAFSPWHNTFTNITLQGTNYVTNIAWPNQGAATLITPRHAINVAHMHFPNGTHVRFVGTDNVTREVVCLYTESVDDINVMVFDQDLPSTVEVALFLPASADHKLGRAMQDSLNDENCLYGNLPIVGCNQYKKAYITDTWYLNQTDWSQNHAQRSLWFPNWGTDTDCQRLIWNIWFTEDQWGGDSGSPAFALINNHLVLIGPWQDCGLPVWGGPFANNLNNAIADLNRQAGINNNYQVSLYDLNDFPDLW